MSYGSADDSSQGVPRALVEPVEKIIEAILDHMMRGAVVEPVKNGRVVLLKRNELVRVPRVEFVDDRLEANDREETRREPNEPCQRQNDKCQQTRPARRVVQQLVHLRCFAARHFRFSPRRRCRHNERARERELVCRLTTATTAKSSICSTFNINRPDVHLPPSNLRRLPSRI